MNDLPDALQSQVALYADDSTRRLCYLVGEDLTVSLDSLGHRRTVGTACLFYRYVFGRCSSGISKLGLVEVEMLVSVELQRCLDVMEFLLQPVLVTGAESTADQCVVDSRLEAWMME